MREVRFNKIAKLMQFSKLAYDIPQDWLDFYRSIKDLDLCQRKEYINDLSREQAIKFNEVLIDLERMGARLPEELKSDTNLRGLTGREVLCSDDVIAKATLPFDLIGSFDVLGPIATLADATSATLSYSIEDYLSAAISTISMIPGADTFTKPLLVFIKAAKAFGKGTVIYRVGDIVIEPEDMEPAAQMLLTNLKYNEDKFVDLLSPDAKRGYDEIISTLERWA
jgi:hypothetical protein